MSNAALVWRPRHISHAEAALHSEFLFSFQSWILVFKFMTLCDMVLSSLVLMDDEDPPPLGEPVLADELSWCSAWYLRGCFFLS